MAGSYQGFSASYAKIVTLGGRSEWKLERQLDGTRSADLVEGVEAPRAARYVWTAWGTIVVLARVLEGVGAARRGEGKRGCCMLRQAPRRAAESGLVVFEG